MAKIKVGFGFDVHQLKEGYDFWLGGIKLDYKKGAVGHSDADVLIHAICDAILGAANLRDIGFNFPDTDPKYKGIDSKILLKEVMELTRSKGYEVGNIDATICLEQPKVNPHIPEMIKVLAEVMEIDADDLSLKATTMEKMSFVGEGKGISAYATVLLEKN